MNRHGYRSIQEAFQLLHKLAQRSMAPRPAPAHAQGKDLLPAQHLAFYCALISKNSAQRMPDDRSSSPLCDFASH